MSFMPMDLLAQWTLSTPQLFTFNDAGAGVIVHKNGLVWAGTRDLFLSRDLGLTWERKNSPVGNQDHIRHIDFWDQQTGLVATGLGDTWLTTDQGTTWKRIRNTPSNWCARFVGSPMNIMVATASYGTLDLSTDQGATWTSQKLGNFVPFIEPVVGNTAYVLAGAGRHARIIITTDLGKTWTTSRDSVGFDSYTFGLDPCSPERVYVVNEDAGGSPNNGLAEIFITSDKGDSWTITYSKALRDLVGSISVASNSIYVQTMSDGIYRSIDFGNTWQNILGPSANFDTRLVCAIDDNLILAADHGGNIWRTVNSGGDSVRGEPRLKSIAAIPEMLFDGDTLLSCDPPTHDTIVINSIFCLAPIVDRIVIEGDHPQDFGFTSDLPAQLTGADTIALAFQARGNGERRANVRIVMKDSTTIVIPMRGFGKGVTELAIATNDVGTDTLGAEVFVPIRFGSLGELPGLSMQFSFESDQLEFVDAYSLDGLSVVSASISDKRKELLFTNPLPVDGIIGHVGLRVYSGSDSCMPVLFDSVKILSTKPPCAFAFDPAMTAHVCIPNDCVAIRVSDYLRYNTLPVFSVIEQRDALLISTDVNAAGVTVRMVNSLGAVVYKSSVEFNTTSPLRIPLQSVRSGLYFIEVRSQIGSWTLKQAILR
jgi:photosystem II stability/assembly factor-like uncharacterized protein